jgi:hypothetical protein
MALNKYERQKLVASVTEHLLDYKFSFCELEISESKTGILTFKFEDASHPIYKNVRILSHDSHVKETMLYTRARVSLRFLHGKHESPIIGLKIVSYNITLS